MQSDPNDPKQNKKVKEALARKQKRLINYQLGFILHVNFSLHVLLLTIINLLVAGIVVGLTSRFYPIIQFETLQAFIIGILLFTLIEVFMKGLMVRYLYRFVMMTFGLMFYICNILSFWLVDISVSQVSFLYNGTNIFVFTIFFMITRLLFSTYIRKSKWIQGGMSHGA